MSKFYIVTCQWSQTDRDSYILRAESRQAIEAMYKARGDRGPRYVEIQEVDDKIFELKNGKVAELNV